MSDEETGVEEVKEATEAEEPIAAKEAATPPLAPPVLEPSDALPPRKQTGLIVVVGSIVLILVLALVFWQPMFDAVSKMTAGKPSVTTETVSPAKAKITTTIGFVEAYMDTDVLKLKPYLVDAAQAAATDTDWSIAASQTGTVGYVFTPPVWTGDTTAALTFSVFDPLAGADVTGTLTFGYAETSPLSVSTLLASGASSDIIVFTLVQAASGWRVASFSIAGQEYPLDVEFVSSIVPTSTP
jgi:hypothetical protein